MKKEEEKYKLTMFSNVFIKKNNKYILITRAKNKESAPEFLHPFGGHIDEKENPLQAAKREIMEESGIELKNIRLKAIVREIKTHLKTPTEILSFHFLADYKSNEYITTHEGKLTEVTKTELLNAKLFPTIKLLINDILKPGNCITFATLCFDRNNNIIKSKNSIQKCNN